MNRSAIDVPRLLRILSAGAAVLAGAVVYASYEPQIDALRARVDDARSEVRSGDTIIADVERLRAERGAFERRYARLLAQNPQAVFLRELAATVRRHGVDLTGSSLGHPRVDPHDDALGTFKRVPLTLQIRGSYRSLLATIADISSGSEIVSVDTPSLQRDGDAVIATVPVAIFEPNAVAR